MTHRPAYGDCILKGGYVRSFGKRLYDIAVLSATLLIAACGGSSSTEAPVPPPPVSISGALSYEFPPPNAACIGLDFNSLQLRPIRGATVQLLDATGSNVLSSTVSDNSGNYSLTVARSTDVIIRVRAELKGARWNVEVRDNVDLSGNPPPLAQRPIFAMDSNILNSGVANQVRNLIATTGWTGSSYTNARVAAPFAILDTIFTAMQFVMAEDPNANFPPLDAFWNPNNKAASPEDIAAGDLQTTYYDVASNSLFLLGSASTDTDEFDDHVIVHEWAHYFEDVFSRTDNLGGSHGRGELVDARVAYSEGWASAFAAMALGNPLYCDTSRPTSGSGFDTESSGFGPDGWFNEQTIIRLIYDLWDQDVDGADSSSIGFGPIYDVMTGPLRGSPAFTSIFSFMTYVRQQGTGQEPFIDALLAENAINPVIDIWGSNEQNSLPGTPDDVIPVYTSIMLGGPAVNICVNSQFDNGRQGNKLSEHRFLRLNLSSPAQVTFTATASPAPSQPTIGFDCTASPNDPENSQHSDPDFSVWANGQLVESGFSCSPNVETTTSSELLGAGDYVIDLNEYRFEDPTSPVAFPERVCFDVTAN